MAEGFPSLAAVAEQLSRAPEVLRTGAGIG